MLAQNFTDEQLIKSHFENHVAFFGKSHDFERSHDGRAIEFPFKDTAIEILYWGQRDSSYSHIWYQTFRGYLMVFGDLGDAIYQWNSGVTLKSVAGFDLHYFHSKCVASESGRTSDWYDWDEREALRQIKEHFIQDGGDKESDTFADEEFMRFRLAGGNDALCEKTEWVQWVQENGEDFFGQDYWEFAFNFGDVIPIGCRLHLLGLECVFAKTEIIQNKT